MGSNFIFTVGVDADPTTQLSIEGSDVIIMAATNETGQFFSTRMWSCHEKRGPAWQVGKLVTNIPERHRPNANCIRGSFPPRLPCTRWDHARRPSESSRRTSSASRKTRRISSLICLWLREEDNRWEEMSFIVVLRLWLFIHILLSCLCTFFLCIFDKE